ncbi:tail assembly protein [Psychrobacter pacificensis]|uniref:tail assembly protein n=1 Tax=Psychrobacter pacificensis TaxID=112002 RepID=UPI001CBC45C3|nr:tail assembly protein [Psychrobacter pacificensis]MBZ1392304.1 tail assembly protein [Psychrobacter pacificensis]
MLRRIELHGILADKFGKSFDLDVESPREACEALSYQVDGFKKFMMTAHESGLFFAVFNDDSNIGENEVEMKTGAKVIRIVPKITGAGGDALGWVQVIAGVALIGLSGGNPALIAAGSGMVLGGAASLLMPRPSIEPQDPDGNKPSYAFGGAVTTVAEGNCVAVGYGRYIWGGSVISMLVVNEDT